MTKSGVLELESLTIRGFKSFGSKKTLLFSKGINAVIGPNGSGKSNVADAIRWVLGEQKNSLLRVSKTEDVIFHGSESMPRASLAEVSLHLGQANETTTVITRKLLGSGESHYSLNGKKTTRATIEEFLATHGFGVHTYTVIGQGTIESLLLRSGLERRLFFEEASGIRQFEIKRAQAEKQLRSAKQNLENTQIILQELRPAATIYQKQQEANNKSSKLQEDIAQAKQQYISHEYLDATRAIKDLEKVSSQHRDKLAVTTKKLEALKASASTEQASTNKVISKDLAKLEKEQDVLSLEIVKTQTQQKNYSESAANISGMKKELYALEKDIAKSKLENKSTDSKIRTAQDTAARIQKKIDDITSILGGLNSGLLDIEKQLSKSQKKEYINHAIGLVQTARIQLRKTQSRKEIDVSLHKLNKMLLSALDDDSVGLARQLSQIQNAISRKMAQREDHSELQTKAIITQRSLELDQASITKAITQLQDTYVAKQAALSRLEETKLSSKELDQKLHSQQSAQNKLANKIASYRAQLNQDTSASDREVLAQMESLSREKAKHELEIEAMTIKKKDLDQRVENVRKLSSDWNMSLPKDITRLSRGHDISLEKVYQMQAQLEMYSDMQLTISEDAKDAIVKIEFLEKQQKDLETAIVDTQEIITKTRKQTSQNFKASFAKLNTAFNTYFVKLFGGGSAQLTLEDTDTLEYGIDIVVSPPGKRTKSIPALSGGERALAAIALLSAILSTNPSPFVVLDEVDAALDDENSKKFSAILTELSQKSQLIIITHNQQTMEIAQTIFGVTTATSLQSEVLKLNL